MKTEGAFSLVEVAVALAVVSFALLTLLALLPLGIKLAGDAVNDTRTSMIAQDAALRIRAIPITGTPGTKLTTNWWYDANGHYLGTNYATGLYRADVVRGTLNSYPINTNPVNQDAANTYSTQLEAATVSIRSPVNTNDGTVPTSVTVTNVYTFYARVVPNL